MEIIARAGGEIDGNIYTNTREALDNSYNKGARMFEMDISKTADGQYVAVHDWSLWAKQTGYVGDIPPDLIEFRKHKIIDKYTSLTFSDINSWFSSHPDSILVTDKINEPEKIISVFFDRKRIKMELFSENEIKNAGKLFDGAMANYHSFKKSLPIFCFYKIYFLKDNNVRYVVSGRPLKNKDKLMLKLLRICGIKVYMYFFGSNSDIDEQVRIYRDYLDGVYYNKIPD
ncbi:hypothetical protein GIX45_00030 [Erwinia sp. CPCC 100877]|nr:hypothetical protein [Erwinia sp. CPCC 100877]